jgi:2-polyprenyl-6-methoxyphenol hydroxylase-like FAD-dependent oxidoreductase
MKVLVLGSGLSGMAAALALGRRGHAVNVIERDATPPPTGAEAAFDAWQRPSIPQFRQPHNFLGLDGRILRERAADVYQAVLAAGASEVEQFRFITDGSHEPDHEELVTLACRRPVFEAVLRRAVAEEDNQVDMRIGCRVGGLAVDRSKPPTWKGWYWRTSSFWWPISWSMPPAGQAAPQPGFRNTALARSAGGPRSAACTSA